MTQLDPEKILTAKIDETYQIYTALIEDYPEIKKSYEKIRFGIKMKFDLYDIFTENYTEKPKRNKIIIKGKTNKLDEFYTELENRERLCKKEIISTIEDQDIFKPRN